jgi:hypothetical protein
MSVFETKKDAARNFLIRIQKSSGDDKGSWPGTFVDGKASFWASMQVLWSLLESGSSFSDKHIIDGIDYVLRSRSKNGAWPEETAGNRDATWKTAVGLLALNSLHSDEESLKDALSKAAKRLAQFKGNDAWGYVEGDRARVRPTATAVLALSTVYRDRADLRASLSKCLGEGIKWLEGSQNVDNGW